ncbi:MAG: sulfur carrier protein ThiS [Selenomonadaceae bacterium]|uniref:Sulfur carrier protein ThiS n=2 Tax=Anaerovibrio slackiae TaxID=2652309 RepID=A0A6I2UCW2_9FIRM|nr:sulfur carrier protein ThiS [Selenomonadaceae bacterium]MSU09343.1 sulfur carrier protein ThiS [Anaerovibrio slackiae]MBQ2411258.1 sulfur carrier protein ThiS [Selenomonadaceae bacterium]MBQ5585570.1 sulfur carrier protein ThiS [Selenomonadaceae bacterium]MBQ5650473.1 sulfur carrier protein ThiS [Selenomonadaceae bacterium]
MEGCAVIINGVQEAAEGKSVAQVLQEKGIDLSNVAVERNGEIVPKRQYDSVILTAEDRLEIVSFVGGG